MRYTLEIKLVHLSLLKSVFILDHKLEIFILSITIQSCRKLFYGEGMRGGGGSKVKVSTNMVGKIEMI